MTLKDLIKDNVAKFSHACEGILYYDIEFEGSSYRFEVDMNDKADVGTGSFGAEEKAIYLMRWIRRAFEQDRLSKL